MQSMVASTLTAAKLLRLDKKLGILEAGKLGDLLVVNGDPLSDIKVLQNQENLVAILKDGEIYKNKTSNRSHHLTLFIKILLLPLNLSTSLSFNSKSHSLFSNFY